jgi:hypothetical protein
VAGADEHAAGTAHGYDGHMTEKVWTAEKLESLTPEEQDAVFESSLVHDPADMPPEFLERIRERARRRLTDTQTPRQ